MTHLGRIVNEGCRLFERTRDAAKVSEHFSQAFKTLSDTEAAALLCAMADAPYILDDIILTLPGAEDRFFNLNDAICHYAQRDSCGTDPNLWEYAANSLRRGRYVYFSTVGRELDAVDCCAEAMRRRAISQPKLSRGYAWFTMQSSIKLGRIVPVFSGLRLRCDQPGVLERVPETNCDDHELHSSLSLVP